MPLPPEVRLVLTTEELRAQLNQPGLQKLQLIAGREGQFKYGRVPERFKIVCVKKAKKVYTDITQSSLRTCATALRSKLERYDEARVIAKAGAFLGYDPCAPPERMHLYSRAVLGIAAGELRLRYFEAGQWWTRTEWRGNMQDRTRSPCATCSVFRVR